MAKLSIILPTYNAQNTIERALDSILYANNCDVEVVVVDDYSTDLTVDLIKKYWAFDKIRLVELPLNVGQAEAKNIGLRHVSSEFVGFLDSDDYFSEGAIDRIMDVLKEVDPDMIIFRYRKLLQNNVLSEPLGGETINSMYTAVWNKVFSKKIIDNIFFPKDAYFEDVAFSARARLRARETNISYINSALYVYVQHETSLVHSAYKEVREASIIETLTPLVNEIQAYNPELKLEYQQLVNSIVLLHAMGPAKTFQRRWQLQEWTKQIDVIFAAQDTWFPGKKSYSNNLLINLKNKAIVFLNKNHLFVLSNLLFKILGILE